MSLGLGALGKLVCRMGCQLGNLSQRKEREEREKR
jgi:hypothetical protein